MEHRHDRQDHVARRAVQRVGQRGRVGVQHGRAVAVEHALRVAGRAGGVAERRRAVLVEQRPVERVAGRRRSGPRSTAGSEDLRWRHVRAIGHRDKGLRSSCTRARSPRSAAGTSGRRTRRGLRRDQRCTTSWSGCSRGLSVCSTAPGARDREVQLHVPVAIPGQRRYALARLDAEGGQRVCHAARALPRSDR